MSPTKYLSPPLTFSAVCLVNITLALSRHPYRPSHPYRYPASPNPLRCTLVTGKRGVSRSPQCRLTRSQDCSVIGYGREVTCDTATVRARAQSSLPSMEAKSSDRTAVKLYAYNTKSRVGRGVKIEKRKITIQRNEEEEEEHVSSLKKKKKKRSFVCRRAL